MPRLCLRAAALLLAVLCSPSTPSAIAIAQVAPAAGASRPPRAVRRDIPLTNAIRRAMAAGTRDSTGRPGAKYWQLRTDYA
ncbi:MAG: M1 family peptidase, partial [Gemmatimonas sp.]